MPEISAASSQFKKLGGAVKNVTSKIGGKKSRRGKARRELSEKFDLAEAGA